MRDASFLAAHGKPKGHELTFSRSLLLVLSPRRYSCSCSCSILCFEYKSHFIKHKYVRPATSGTYKRVSRVDRFVPRRMNLAPFTSPQSSGKIRYPRVVNTPLHSIFIERVWDVIYFARSLRPRRFFVFNVDPVLRFRLADCGDAFDETRERLGGDRR
ncbi:hypothetical protein Pla100_58980 [Neorhodopirellula pilleata]|uniref:Uncharacterized protein n=1 Tax=Neorhodopirellula pilleata TaxID=2714738 RepID=A0A5C5ZKB5_9BACT|nr:hypothetical protein Pla100_58980 [Neorhodopirellula pilleata]